MTSIFKEFYERKIAENWKCHTAGYLFQGIHKDCALGVMKEIMRDYFDMKGWNLEWNSRTQILTCINEEERKKHIYSIK